MYIIGISALYHDSSVCLFKDDQLIFSVEEERFTGIKHDSTFPYNSLRYIIDHFSIKKEEIECVCFYETPYIKLERLLSNFFKHPIKSFGYTLNSISDWKDNDTVVNTNLLQFSRKHHYELHHNSHLFYSYYTSGFKDSIVVSIDGVGEYDTMVYSIFKDGKMVERVPVMKYPHSIGLFYSALTSFIGFRPNSGEYKLMGLSGFGNPFTYYDRMKKLFINDTELNMKYFTWNTSHSIMFNEKLPTLLGIPNRLPEEKITQAHKDIAATTQLLYETFLFDYLNKIYKKTKGISSNLCIGGGCAYNGVANGKILQETPFTDLWVPSSPSDAGSAVGAVLGYLHKHRKTVNKITQDPFLGPEYTDEDIQDQLKSLTQFDRYTDKELYTTVSHLLKDGKTVGWCRGRIEFGARALGNRSILANPFIKGTRDKINSIIKKREGFRPFAPMVLHEHQSTYFNTDRYIPYMNEITTVKEEYVKQLEEVSNVDRTSRIQSITEENNKSMYNLLSQFSSITDFPPILLNTSFNVRGQTMVLTPKMAYDTFIDTDLDVLVLNNYIIQK